MIIYDVVCIAAPSSMLVLVPRHPLSHRCVSVTLAAAGVWVCAPSFRTRAASTRLIYGQSRAHTKVATA